MSVAGGAGEGKDVQEHGVSGTGLSAATEPAAAKFHATVEEVVKALLHDVFLLVQPTLTRAVRAIFVIVFGDSEWLARYKSYLGP